MFVRFSTVAGNKGSADLARDVRGFAVKFYTQEGNWDLVGNNIPVFFVQDAMKFPDLVHAVKDEPDRGFPQAQSAHDNFWDFASLMPETTHMLMWVMSDRAIPRAFRFMEGFGVHTFRFVNAAGESSFVKFHWKPKLGMQSVVWNEAVKLNGADPDFHRRDLWNSIQSGAFPEWELGVQVFDEAFADEFPFDVLDATKLIPEELVPIRKIGRLVLDRVVDNFFAETEQAAFCTNNIVPGIDFTNDPLLQGRNFSYLDTQLKRLGGPNFTHLPINAPKCPFANFQQDGHMAMFNPAGRANYEPNSWSGDERGPREDAVNGFHSFAAAEGGETRRVRAELFADHYSQARQFYVSQTPVEQTHIANSFVFELSKVERPDIRTRMVANLRNVDEDLAATVADGLGLAAVPSASAPARAPISDLAASPALSILANPPGTFEGRKLGILVTDGTDARLLAALTAAAEAEGAVVELIAPKIGGIVATDKVQYPAQPEDRRRAVGALRRCRDHPVGSAALRCWPSNAAAKDFVNDAHNHCKFVGYSPSAVALFDAAGLTDLIDGGYVRSRCEEDDVVELHQGMPQAAALGQGSRRSKPYEAPTGCGRDSRPRRGRVDPCVHSLGRSSGCRGARTGAGGRRCRHLQRRHLRHCPRHAHGVLHAGRDRRHVGQSGRRRVQRRCSVRSTKCPVERRDRCGSPTPTPIASCRRRGCARSSRSAQTWTSSPESSTSILSRTSPAMFEAFTTTYILDGDSHGHVHGANIGMCSDAYLAVGGWCLQTVVGEDHVIWNALRDAGPSCPADDRGSGVDQRADAQPRGGWLRLRPRQPRGADARTGGVPWLRSPRSRGRPSRHGQARSSCLDGERSSSFPTPTTRRCWPAASSLARPDSASPW